MSSLRCSVSRDAIYAHQQVSPLGVQQLQCSELGEEIVGATITL